MEEKDIYIKIRRESKKNLTGSGKLNLLNKSVARFDELKSVLDNSFIINIT